MLLVSLKINVLFRGRRTATTAAEWDWAKIVVNLIVVRTYYYNY